MTAGVVVMNSAAVALAADSAVTIPYSKGVKHYRGASKLVSAHVDAPVAALWYGSPDYMGVPWEVIVKDFRFDRRDRCARVADYAQAFLNYTDKNLQDWAPVGAGKPAAAELAEPLFTKLQRALRRGIGEPAVTITSEIHDWRTQRRPIKRVLADDQILECDTLLAWLDERLDRLATDVKGITGDARATIRSAALSAWTHFSANEPLHSGLVFAGFGDEERLPVMCHFLIGLPAEDKPRRAQRESAKVSAKDRAYVYAVAQNQEVRTFMEGVQPTLKVFVETTMKGLTEFGVDGVVVDGLTRQLRSFIEEQRRSVIEAVAFLPKAELAEFARHLVAVSAFRQRMSMADETVGEPIEVAVVSRAEGVVWIHRHHYFPPDLNPGFRTRHQLPSNE